MAPPPKSFTRKPGGRKPTTTVKPAPAAPEAVKSAPVASATPAPTAAKTAAEAPKSAPVASAKPAPEAAKIAPEPVKVPPVATPVAAQAKPMPFVMDAEKAKAPIVAEPAPVAAPAPAPAPVAKQPVVESPPTIKSPTVETPPVKTPIETPPVVSTFVEPTPVKPSTPSQPVVAETLTAAIETPAVWQTPQLLEGKQIMNEAIETTKKFAEEAKSRVQSMLAEMNDKAKAAMEKSSKAMEEIGDIAKGNVEAVVESSKIAAKGIEGIGQSAAEYGRVSFEKTSATLKSFASVKSPTEFFQLQSELMTSAFDTLASETAKTSEAMLKLAGEIAQPISSRVSVVSDKIKAFAA
jgi:phasin family protein